MGVVGSERGPEEQRPRDGVAGRLEEGDVAGRLLVGALIGGQHQVEVLAGDDLATQRGEDGPRPCHCVGGERGAVEELVGPHEGEVAGEDRRARPEPVGVAHAAAGPMVGRHRCMGAGPAPACGRSVHHVVVEQGEGVQQLHRSGWPQHRLVVLRTRGTVAPVHEGRAKALPPGRDEALDLVSHLAEGRVDRHHLGGLGPYELVEQPAEGAAHHRERAVVVGHDRQPVGGLRRTDGLVEKSVGQRGVSAQEPRPGLTIERVEQRDLLHRPRAQRPGVGRGALAEVAPGEPRQVVHLVGVEQGRALHLCHHDRAQLVLGRAVGHHRPVGEVGQRHPGSHHSEPELLRHAADHGLAQGLPHLRVAAAAVRPRARPGRLRARPAREEHAAVAIHEVTGEREVERRGPVVGGRLRSGGRGAAPRIEQDDVIGGCGYLGAQHPRTSTQN